ncbi:hypothetical protein [Hymenobacter profundi]|uniref:DUF1440 domain-containing protein n=1 Tax=Hymenobacter profundi TaxID=1982110 RepID=A0ABS6WU53_9BACT|nr:hypothetical protein [Hymenobacter profundi]MBW3127107.1 hypothetical protein [Hymenobacter profundi]
MKKHPRLFLGLLAGLVAITANTLVLKAAPLLPVNAESGGLLKLALLHTTPLLPAGLLPVVQAAGFKLLFHYLTGLGMVGLYVLVFEPRLPGKGWVKGGLFSLLPWAINGLVVLPLLGQGVAGVHALTAGGIAYFFVANAVFGLVLGGVYAYLRQRQTAGAGA